jgi:hypothetical protein
MEAAHDSRRRRQLRVFERIPLKSSGNGFLRQVRWTSGRDFHIESLSIGLYSVSITRDIHCRRSNTSRSVRCSAARCPNDHLSRPAAPRRRAWRFDCGRHKASATIRLEPLLGLASRQFRQQWRGNGPMPQAENFARPSDLQGNSRRHDFVKLHRSAAPVALTKRIYLIAKQIDWIAAQRILAHQAGREHDVDPNLV